MSVNKAILIGNLGADPETRTTQGGTAVTNLRIATSERKKDKDGNWADHTEWHRVVCFGKTAENAQKYLVKGKQVYVEGVLRTTKYTDKAGVEKYSTEIICNDLKFLGSKSDGGGRSESGGSGNYDTGSGHGSQGGSDDDIPF